MAFPEEIPQPVVPTKRRLDDDDDCELAELKKPKTVVQKYPPPKIRLGVQVSRDFPPGCGIIHESLEVERKPMKKLDNVDANFKDKMANSKHFESKKLNYSFKPKGLGLKKSYFGTKSSNKVKFWDPMQHVVDDIPPVYGIIGERNSKFVERNTFELRKRKKNYDALIVYDTYYTQLSQENGLKQKAEKIPPSRVPAMAAKITIQKLKWMSPEKSLGEISGTQIGDKFKFRSQLQMVGLHSQPNCGIDYIDINGKNLAISIVDSRRYSKEIGQSRDVLSYCGEGGGRVQFGFSKGHVANDDQKLVRGNLALKNSMKEKSPIRVIRKVVGVGKKNYFFVYDGLYIVKDCRQRRSLGDRMVFMFKLHKIPGQCHVQKWVNAIPGDVALYQCSTFQMLI